MYRIIWKYGFQVIPGVDQGMGEIIVEFARRVNYSLPEGQHFEDGSTEVDYFEIYANDIEEDE